MYFIYIVRCSDNSLYTGIAKDPVKRVYEHNHDDRLAAAYTRSRRPVEMVYHEKCDSRSRASKRENEIKKMSKQEKEDFLKNS